MEEENNEIDESFKKFLSKISPPNDDKKWLQYVEQAWITAYADGVDFTIKTFEDEIKNIVKSEEQK